MTFAYYEKDQADQYSFIRIPKAMMTEDVFAPLSVEAKILYGLLLDKMGAAVKNQWLDEENKAYVIYQITDIMEDMNISKKKAIASLKELEEVGLVEKKLAKDAKATRRIGRRVLINVKVLNKYIETMFDEG
ncbi:MAG: replication initiator protein A [Agathobacter sp.]|nr:replication initiator protein A [Agathobacter sp.]